MNSFALILGFPKLLYFNLKSMPLKSAIKLPILVSYRTKFKCLSGKIKFSSPIRFGMVKIGFSGGKNSNLYAICNRKHWID